jgi:Spy/CpxP family protein refolding chaperone
MRSARKLLMGSMLIGAVGLAFGVSAHMGSNSHQGHGMGMMGGMGGGHGRMGHATNLEALADALKLTAAQRPAWEKYEQTVRSQTEARQKMREGMHSGKVEHRAMHETMAAFNRQAATELAQAREGLESVLTPEQRQVLGHAGRGRGHMAQRGGEHRNH